MFKFCEAFCGFYSIMDKVWTNYGQPRNSGKIKTRQTALLSQMTSLSGGDAARCADELFYVPGTFGVVVYL